ncbi:MAG: hypothetical protein ACKO04_01805 [Actinomycetes bacterium]
MTNVTGRACASCGLRTSGEGGFTLLEAVLVIFVTSIGILSVAYGLLAAVNADGRANKQERLNLAMTTAVDALKQAPFLPVQCPAVSSPAPRSDDAALSSNSTPAGRYLRRVVGTYNAGTDSFTDGDEGVQDWIRQGVVFSIVDASYWAPSISSGNGYRYAGNPDTSLQACNDDPYSYPVTRLTVTACWDTPGVTGCDQGGGTIRSTVALRGPRLENP